MILAEGVNLGLRKMADATADRGFWELMRIARWHVEGEAYDRALSAVVEAQAALPMAALWGSGRTASRRRECCHHVTPRIGAVARSGAVLCASMDTEVCGLANGRIRPFDMRSPSAWVISGPEGVRTAVRPRESQSRALWGPSHPRRWAKIGPIGRMSGREGR